MTDVSSLLLSVLLPVVCLWAGTTGLVTLAMVRLTAPRRGTTLPALSAELWGAVAASGAAAGAVLGLGTAAPALPLAATPGALARLLGVVAGGMLLGAALTAGLVLLAVWLWGDEG